MATTTSNPSKVGNNYYKTSVTTNADGSLSATTFRTDAKGNGSTAVSTVNTDKNGKNTTRTFASGATDAEKKAFSDPNSAESKAYSNQVQSLNPYGANATAEQKQVVNSAAGSPNAATTQEDAEQQLKSELAKEVAGTRNSFPGANGGTPLKYPRNLADTKQDVIKFKMVKYSPKELDKTAQDKNTSAFKDRRAISDKNTIGVVVLPIPAGIGDANSVNWGSNEVGPLGSNLYNIADAAITGGGAAGAETAGGTAEALAANPQDSKTGLTQYFKEAASGTTNMLSRTQGAVFNSNMELLFNGPSLRPFSFTFKLSARSKDEAKDIRSIIRFFKQGMSPIRTESQLFLKAPHTFQLEYLHIGKSHSFLNRFKECALQSFTVDYTPEGQYATFSDGAMVSYQITMQFQELEPIFNDDYSTIDENKDTDIGY